MSKNIQTIPKKQLAFIYVTTLAIDFILATISFIFVPWLGISLVVIGNITLLYGGYLLLKKHSQKG